MTPAPTVSTARLELRGPQKRDLAAFTAWVRQSVRMEAVGRVGIGNHTEWPQPELALHLSGACEVACAAYDWARRRLWLESMISLIAPANARALALATRRRVVEERRDMIATHRIPQPPHRSVT